MRDTARRLAKTLLLAGLVATCGESLPEAPSARQRLLEQLGDANLVAPFAAGTLPDELDRYPAAQCTGSPSGEQRALWPLRRVSLLVAGARRLEDRDALILPPPSRVEWPVVVRGEMRLQLQTGLLTRSVERKAPATIITVSFLPETGVETRLATRHLRPGDNAGLPTWNPIDVSLADLTPGKGRIILTTERAGEATPLANPWSNIPAVASPVLLERSSATDRRNVILIGVDTLRADHLSCYGYPRKTSPRLDAFAGEGIRFHRAIAPAPWTLPSFTSILTSLYPSRHGAGRGGRGGWTRVHPDALFLPEILSAHGYLTCGMVANDLISPKYGLDQGYEAYSYPVGGRGMESVQVEVPRIQEFLAENRNVPFFLFWHIMDCHLPYSVPDAIAREWLDPAYEGRFRRQVGFQTLVQRPGRRRFAHEGHPPIPDMTDADRHRIVDFYDAEIAEMDAAVGAVLDTLKELGLDGKTIVAFTADHGEGLGDHGHYHHGYTLYEDQVRVPLLLRYPGGPKGKVIAPPVSTVDVVPVILSLLDLPVPEEMQGVNRLDTAHQDAPVYTEYATYDSSALKAIYSGDLKYLHDPVFRKREAFDVGKDPGELHDALPEDPSAFVASHDKLSRFRVDNIQGDRYHLRIDARPGSRIKGRLTAGDVFDSNAAALPGVPEETLRFDLERKHLDFEMTVADGPAEVLFWYRGDDLEIRLEMDGTVVPGDRIHLGSTDTTVGPDGKIATHEIPSARGSDVSPAARPDPTAVHALLWMEDAGLRPLLTTDSEEELQRLRELGYVR